MERCLGDKGEKPSIHTKEAGFFPEANKVSAKAFRQAAGTQNQGKFVLCLLLLRRLEGLWADRTEETERVQIKRGDK